MKRERESNGKDKGKSAEDIGMYLDQFLEDVVDLPSELQVHKHNIAEQQPAMSRVFSLSRRENSS